ncbi:hypothetical protein GCM10027271_08540 [Saccharopolyspora gloriosae]
MRIASSAAPVATPANHGTGTGTEDPLPDPTNRPWRGTGLTPLGDIAANGRDLGSNAEEPVPSRREPALRWR